MLLRAPGEPCSPPNAFLSSVPTGTAGAMAVAFSPDGALLAVACADDLTYPVRVYDVELPARPRLLATLPGHGALVYSLDWAPDSQWLATASADGTACVSFVPHTRAYYAAPASAEEAAAALAPPPPQLLAGVPLRPYSVAVHAPASYVYAARFHPLAPHLLVTGAYDRGLRLWDTRIAPAAGPGGALAPAGWLLGALAGGGSGGGPCAEATLLGFIGADPNDRLAAAAAAGDGGGDGVAPFASGRGDAAALPPPRQAQAHGGYVNVVEFERAPPPAAAGPAILAALASAGAGAGSSSTAAATSSGRRMVSCDSQGVVMLWLATPPPPLPAERAGAAAAAEWVGPDGEPALPRCFVLLRVLRPAVLRGLPIVAAAFRPGATATASAGGPNQLLLLGHSNVLRLYDLASGGALRAFPGAACAASRLDAVFSPDGRLLAAGSEAGALALWDAETGAALPAQARVEGSRRAAIAFPGAVLYGVAWSPSRQLLAMCSFGSPLPAMLVGAPHESLARQRVK